jgi:hypothetical protein
MIATLVGQPGPPLRPLPFLPESSLLKKSIKIRSKCGHRFRQHCWFNLVVYKRLTGRFGLDPDGANKVTDLEGRPKVKKVFTGGRK